MCKYTMADKKKIDYLLLDIRELEKLIAGIRDAEVYPVSFFTQAFDLTHKLLHNIHALEALQIEQLRQQLIQHQAMLKEIPFLPTAAQPDRQTREKEDMFSVPTDEMTVEEVPVQELSGQPDLQSVAETIVPTDSGMCPKQPTAGEIPADAPAAPDDRETLLPEDTLTDVANEMTARTAVSSKATTCNLSLNEILQKKSLSDFRKAFSLNDRFFFRRELFAGDEQRMNRVIADLNELHSYEESIEYLDKHLQWNIEDRAVSEFVKLLEKRFI